MDNLFQIAKSKQVEELELYKAYSSNTSLKTFNKQVESYQISEQNVISIRGIVNGKMGYVYTEDLNESAISLIDRLIHNASIIDSEDYEEIFAGSDEYIKIPNKFDGKIPIYDDILGAMHTLDDTAKSTSKLITDVNVSYSESISKVTIENSKGLTLSKENHQFVFVGSVVARNDGNTSNAWEYEVKQNFKELNPKTIGSKAAETAVKELGGEPCATGTYKAILKHDAINSILGVLAGLFYAENVQKGMSPLKEKLGTTIVGKNINLLDDPHLEDGFNTTPFDDEGVATTKTVLIENGVLKSYLYNLKSAHKDQVQTTGNGFKSSVAGKVITQATNFYIPNGNLSDDEMLSEVVNGIMITDVAGTHAGINSYNGDFSLQSEGFLIENGIVTKPVRLITIAGNIFDLLSNVVGIGSDLKLSYSGVGSPSMIIDSLQVSGK